MNTVMTKLAETSKYLNTQKTILVYGELCRQANKHPDINFNARFECAKSLIASGVKVKAFGRYTKKGVTIICSIAQEPSLISEGWTKIG